MRGKSACCLCPAAQGAQRLLGRIQPPLFALGHLDEAFMAFEKATLLAPDEPDAWFNKAIVLEKLGRKEEAASCQEKARSLERLLAT